MRFTLTWLDDFPCHNIDLEHFVVEMQYREGATSQRSEKIDRLLENEVVALSLELVVLLLLNDNDDIARHGVGRLVGLASKSDRLTVLHALVHCYLQHFTLLDHLVAVAGLALVFGVDQLALTVTI